MDSKKYLIVTTKSWNIERTNRFKTERNPNVSLITDRSELTYERVRQIDPRYIFFPHWSWKISKEIYENWECVVFHMTDLPFGRGGSPLQNLLERGIYKTRISALKVVEEIDAGPVYLKSDFIDLSGSAKEIFVTVSDIIFGVMILRIIREEPVPVPQIGEPVFFKRRMPKQSNIFHLDNLTKVFDHIRMLDAEGYPPAFLEKGNLRFEFTNARMMEDSVLTDVKITSKGKV